jgi:hypothetical protein
MSHGMPGPRYCTAARTATGTAVVSVAGAVLCYKLISMCCMVSLESLEFEFVADEPTA